MIQRECIAWVGKYDEVYSDDVEAWRTGFSTDDVSVVDCAQSSPDPSSKVFDPDFEGRYLTGGSLFETEKVILFRNTQEWDEDTELVPSLDLMIREFSGESLHIGIIHKGGIPSDAFIEKYIDELVDERVPYGIPDEFVEWITNWLESRDRGISKSDANKISDYCGNQESLIPPLVAALKWWLSDTNPGDTLKLDDIKGHFGDLGSIDSFFEIREKIVKGDRAGVDEVVRRLSRSSHPLVPYKYIAGIYPKYARALNPNYMDRGVSPGYWNYLRREANTLGQRRVVACMAAIADYERKIKFNKIDEAWFHAAVLFDYLTRQFIAASKKKPVAAGRGRR